MEPTKLELIKLNQYAHKSITDLSWAVDYVVALLFVHEVGGDVGTNTCRRFPPSSSSRIQFHSRLQSPHPICCCFETAGLELSGLVYSSITVTELQLSSQCFSHSFFRIVSVTDASSDSLFNRCHTLTLNLIATLIWVSINE